jgi:hypothetical protein|tara:strand:- start:2287 stop:2748 length:462 start_codon:yes stop_codon:yes gene_type:complete
MKIKKSKKDPKIQYGIEITKPHSKNMYSHNDMVAKEMKFNIKDAWHNEAIKFMGDDEWPTEGKIVEIQNQVCAVGYGDGYTINEVERDFYSELDNMPNWQLHEVYSYMSFKNNMVPRTRFMMVGFEWQKHDYSFCTDIDISPIARMEEQVNNI